MNHVSAYSQIVARTGAERGYLLDKDKLQRLAESKNLTELTVNLRGSPYENLLKTSTEPSPENLQRVFNGELARLYRKTMLYSPNELQVFLRDYISRLEIENLKTLLRAKNAHLSYESITAMLNLPTEDLLDRQEIFVEAAKAGDIKGSLKHFEGTPYAQALSEALPLFEEAKSTRFFELTLDRDYHERLFDSTATLSKDHSKMVLPILGPQIDIFNIDTIVRSKFLNFPPQWVDMAVTSEFYKLSSSQIHALMLIESSTSALTILKETAYRRFYLVRNSVEETLTGLEKAVKQNCLKQLNEMRIRDAFSISTPLSIIMEKEVEVENLTKITSGVEHNWTTEEIASILV